jgi:hypothetical protein
MPDYDPTTRTRTLARIIGPYLVIVSATLFVRHDAMPALLSSFMRDEPLVFATAAFTLIAGLTSIVAHHHWSGAAAIAISLVGIGAAFKGAWLMIAPQLGADMTAVFVATPPYLWFAAGVELLIGLWLCFVGWTQTR